MLMTQSISEINVLLLRQLSSFFVLSEDDKKAVEQSVPCALDKCERSFSKTRNKYYSEAGVTKFDPLHGRQWGASVSDKLYALNKAMASVDLFYQVELPDIFTFDHPLGSVMGRASYSDYFTFSQGCTVGNNRGIYPRFGQSVFMLSDSKVIGDCEIGSNVIIGANAYVKDVDIPSNSLVFGQSPNLVIKENRADAVRSYVEEVFRYE